MSFEMSLNVSVISCLLLVSIKAQQIDVFPVNNGTVKETIYDIKLYITVPASVVALGLLFCLCYCLVCAFRDPFRDPEQQGIRPFQPVIVTNRSSPLVISSQNTSHNESVEGVNVIPGPNQMNNAQRPQQNQSFLDRIWNRNNTPQPTAPKRGVVPGVPKKYGPTKANQKTGTQISSNVKQNLVPSNPSTSQLGSTSRQSRSPYQRQESANTSQSHYKTQAKQSANSSANNSMESGANHLEDLQLEDFDLDQNLGTTDKKSKQTHVVSSTIPSNTLEGVGKGAEDGYSG